MKHRMLLGFYSLAVSQFSMANDEYVTVCSYTPADTFQEPEEITPTDSYTCPTCPSNILATVMVSRRIVIGSSDGNDFILLSQEPKTKNGICFTNCLAATKHIV